MHKFALTIRLSLTVITIGAASHVEAETPSGHAKTLSGNDRAFFENRIRPVLVNYCYECHSTEAKDVGGKLLLDSRDGVLKGGQSGPALVVGHPEQSLILQALCYDDLEMPPERPLPESVVNDFAVWIRHGAADPRVMEAAGDAPSAVASEGVAAVDRDAIWSFLPRRAASVPENRDRNWAYDPLDRFVLARIESAQLAPTRDAPAATLVRRLYYDLVGLRPTAEEVETFVAEHHRDRVGATRRLVDSLMQQPQFGERWGRHWLDVARFGESNGDDGLGRNATFPHAWRYRDYVIDAFNNDLPYDRFLTEQIAGDLLPAESAEQRNRQLVATGFLAIGSKPAKAMNDNFAMDIVDDQINVVSTAVMGLSVSCARCHDHKHDPIPTRDYYAMAGIFSSTETLYGLAANEGLTAPPTPLHTLTSIWNKQTSAIAASQATPEFPATYAAAIDQLGPRLHVRMDVAPKGLTVESPVHFSQASFAQLETANIYGRLPVSGNSYSVAFWFKNDTANEARPITAYLFSRGQLGNADLPGDHLGIGGNHDPSQTGKLFVFNGNVAKDTIAGATVIPEGTWNHVVLVRDRNRVRVFLNGNLEIDAALPATFADSPDYCLANRSDKFAPLVGNLAEFAIFERALTDDEADTLHSESGQPRGQTTLGLAMGVREKAKPADCKIHVGGETGKLGMMVPRGFLTAHAELLSSGETRFDGADFTVDSTQSGRRQLAAWLTHPDHPQTARVMANRIWLHLFGQAIVATPDDFGVYGARPSNPELLDHLAERLICGGWSIKRLIRCIVLSHTYQLDSRNQETVVESDRDSENTLFAYHDRRRLDAESLRDSILRSSGRLELNRPTGSPIEQIDALINWPPGESTNLHQASNHRSVYLCMLRHAPPPELAAFNLPDGVGVVGAREDSTLPTQSLFLLNSRFIVENSVALATGVLELHQRNDSSSVRAIFRRILQRNPSESEVRRSLEHVKSIASSLEGSVTDSQRRRIQSWASLCQALFATNEFRYID